MWCRRRMEKIRWTDRETNQVLQRVKEERIIIKTIKRKAKWTCQVFHRNHLLKHVIEGKTEGRIEMTGRRGRREQLLDDLKEEIGLWQLKKEALLVYHTL
jgi:hypothetical protein